jgi:hypothetical protein
MARFLVFVNPSRGLYIGTVHGDVPSGSHVRVLPCPALARVVLEAHPLDVVLRPQVNQEVR